MPVCPPFSWSAPETKQPEHQRKDGTERCADRELKRQNVGEITGGKKDARAESDENAKYGAKKPSREKGSEDIKGGCACFRATTQRQQRQRNHASANRASLDTA